MEEVQSCIVIIGGLPCSGKSTLAARLGAQWTRPLLSKDEFKESLFESLGSGDRAWSRRISLAAYDLMFLQAEKLARCGLSFMIEGNFRDRDHVARFRELAALGATLVQVHCRALPEVLVGRFAERARLQSRHQGHADRESLPEIAAEMRTVSQAPLQIEGGIIIDCDTTEDWSAAIDGAIERLLASLGRLESPIT